MRSRPPTPHPATRRAGPHGAGERLRHRRRAEPDRGSIPGFRGPGRDRAGPIPASSRAPLFCRLPPLLFPSPRPASHSPEQTMQPKIWASDAERQANAAFARNRRRRAPVEPGGFPRLPGNSLQNMRRSRAGRRAEGAEGERQPNARRCLLRRRARHITQTGRTSTVPEPAAGQRAAQDRAASRSGTSIK